MNFFQKMASISSIEIKFRLRLKNLDPSELEGMISKLPNFIVDDKKKMQDRVANKSGIEKIKIYIKSIPLLFLTGSEIRMLDLANGEVKRRGYTVKEMNGRKYFI